jgi:hypothetical protein
VDELAAGVERERLERAVSAYQNVGAAPRSLHMIGIATRPVLWF